MSLTPAELAMWTIEMTIKYGVPAVKELISTWSSDTAVTHDMIKELEAEIKKPEAYFEE